MLDLLALAAAQTGRGKEAGRNEVSRFKGRCAVSAFPFLF